MGWNHQLDLVFFAFFMFDLGDFYMTILDHFMDGGGECWTSYTNWIL